jgi:hypothetical protein
VRLAIRRVYDFGREADVVGPTLLTPEAWDAVRRLPGAFELASSREDWLEAGAAEPYPSRAAAVANVLRELGASSLCSHGVGTALLEQRLHLQAAELRLTCTDFAPETIARLQTLFDGVELVVSDLRDAASFPPADAHLMHRLDQELTRAEWHGVFSRLDAPVLFVPSEILSPGSAVKELLRRALRPRATSAGLFRNEAALRDLWSPWFDDRRLAVADETGYLLTPRGSRPPLGSPA